jgi:CSLREA domain-containing protein
MMKLKTIHSLLTPAFAAGILLALLLLFAGAGTSQAAVDHVIQPTGVLTTPVTTITVNSTADLDTSDSNTCISKPADPCTLRRAVIQARNLPANEKPVLIAFNIPTSDSGYNPTLQIWKIQFIGISSNANATLRYLNGNIIIDGSTQPGGRTNGPKIILVGPGTGQWDGIKLGESGLQNANEIRGLGLQMFKTHMYVNSSNNIIADNWFGLNDAGTGIVLRGGGEDDGSGNTGVSVMANTTGNTIQNNVFTGLAGVAAAINGDDGVFSNNYVGTIANGTVPDKETDPSLICLQWDWLGGSGLSMSGDGNTIENNVIAGLRIAVEPPTIQADAIRVGGDENIIRNNKIGVDATNVEVGVCGRGIYLQGGTEFNQITTNRIIKPGLSAISLNDTPVVSTSDANTLRGNVIKKLTPWGEIEGNNSPEDAIQMTKSLPDAFRNFKPAAITTINGVSVSGTSGANSPCPNCIIEIFLDDTDAITETLQSLAVVTANASGNWNATLPAALTSGQALRTTSTTAQNNTIAGMSLGTTTGLSKLYLAESKIYLPLTIR